MPLQVRYARRAEFGVKRSRFLAILAAPHPQLRSTNFLSFTMREKRAKKKGKEWSDRVRVECGVKYMSVSRREGVEMNTIITAAKEIYGTDDGVGTRIS